MLTVEEAAGRMDVVPETVRRLLRERKLPGWRLGRKSGWRIRESDLETFIASRMNTSQPPDSETFR